MVTNNEPSTVDQRRASTHDKAGEVLSQRIIDGVQGGFQRMKASPLAFVTFGVHGRLSCANPLKEALLETAASCVELGRPPFHCESRESSTRERYRTIRSSTPGLATPQATT